MQRFCIARSPSLTPRAAVVGRCELPLFPPYNEERPKGSSCIGSLRLFHRTTSNHDKKRSTRNRRGEEYGVNYEKFNKHYQRRLQSRDTRNDRDRDGRSRQHRQPRTRTRTSISIYVRDESTNTKEKFDPRILGSGWTTPSHPTSNHPVVSEVLKTGKLPSMNELAAIQPFKRKETSGL